MRAFNKRMRLNEYMGIPFYCYLLMALSFASIFVIFSLHLLLLQMVLGGVSFLFFCAAIYVYTHRDVIPYWKIYWQGRQDNRRTNTEL